VRVQVESADGEVPQSPIPRFPVWRSFWLALSGSAGRFPFHRREGEIVFRGPVGPPIPGGKSRLGMAKLRAGVSPAPRSSVAHEINCRAVALQVWNINWVVKLLGAAIAAQRSVRMCDYSLHNVMTRPAKVGDKLKTVIFNNAITRGFAAIEDP
jgi:hypothetical protein